ncbi:DUF7661 family protein [Photobacterium frigidiphilum]|uniref:DUF7661 family protein n=1 Tax=Photobacterium frigidiphilum TaxID=264736 RepID=UPI003D0F3E08
MYAHRLISSCCLLSKFWILYLESDISMRVRIYDVVIPSEFKESELASYLADIFHENASDKNSSVERMK